MTSGLSMRFNALRPDDVLRGKPEGTRIYRLFLATDGAMGAQETLFTLLHRHKVEIVSYDPSIPCCTVLSAEDLCSALSGVKLIAEIVREEPRRSARSPHLASPGRVAPLLPGA